MSSRILKSLRCGAGSQCRLWRTSVSEEACCRVLDELEFVEKFRGSAEEEAIAVVDAG